MAMCVSKDIAEMQ